MVKVFPPILIALFAALKKAHFFTSFNSAYIFGWLLQCYFT